MSGSQFVSGPANFAPSHDDQSSTESLRSTRLAIVRRLKPKALFLAYLATSAESNSSAAYVIRSARRESTLLNKEGLISEPFL